MAEYKRFISYIYKYENGQKSGNKGFAKIEDRNGICRLQMTMKDIRLTDNEVFNVSFFVREGENIVGIPVKKSLVAMNDIRDVFKSTNIYGTSYSMNDIRGIIITVTDDNNVVTGFYATSFDDKTIEAARYITYEDFKLLEKNDTVIEKEDNESDEVKTDIADKVYKELAEEAVTEEITEEKVVTEQEAVVEQEDDDIIKNNINSEFNKCKKISLSELSELPRQNWHLGSNSFLLHGYYNYKYIAICEDKNDNGSNERYIGVPGVYNNNEKFMASMFGFKKFISSEKKGPNTGQFGYWCMKVVE